jgi:hypothetical protein
VVHLTKPKSPAEEAAFQLGKCWRIAKTRLFRAEVEKAYQCFSSGASKEDREILDVIPVFNN